MLKASFPMYNIPEIRAAQSALWKGIAVHLKRAGVEDLPDDLAHGRPLAELLSDQNMLISQCCGYDVVQRYRETLVLVAAPVFDVAECSGHEYSSLIVVAQDSPYRDVLDMRGSIAAANGPESHSGMSSLRHLVAPKSANGAFFGSVTYSGGHVQSLRLIQSGQADVAAIDSVTYALLERYRPSATEGLRKLGRTFFAPAPPYVTHVDRVGDTARRLKTALRNAFCDPDLETCRAALLLKGIDDVDRKTYEKILDFEIYAAKLGYPELR
ncbi:MAG: PhnD/SsuA/transferrin family substrate-binding protein [Pseudomonadota bacterium]